MSILLNNNGYGSTAWADEIGTLLPGFPVHIYPDIPDRNSIRYALVWDHPHGDLASYPNLRAILSLGAGVEHLTADPDLPDLPIIRLSDPAVARDMGLHCLYWVLNFHRHYHRYTRQQKDRHWCRHDCPSPENFRVGIMGLGLIGTQVSKTIARNGYATSGWNLGEKQLPDISCHHGESELRQFLSGLDLLVNCLPLTSTTRDLIDRSVLEQLPRGSFLVNISRGAVINHTDLLTSLDAGHLAGAALDAFDEEPLPATSRLWIHEKVHVTPHMSGATYAASAAKIVAANINRLERGEQPFPLYDRLRGY